MTSSVCHIMLDQSLNCNCNCKCKVVFGKVWSAFTARRHSKTVQHWRNTCARRGTRDCAAAMSATDAFTLPAIWSVFGEATSCGFRFLNSVGNYKVVMLLSWRADLLCGVKYARMTSTRTRTTKQQHQQLMKMRVMMMLLIVMHV